MKLDVTTGELTVGVLIVGSNALIGDQEGVVIEQINPASSWKHFTLRNLELGIAGVRCYFKEDVIQWVSIYLMNDDLMARPFEISDRQRALAYKRVIELGGEQAYEWGKVGVSEDPRSGSISIIVSYLEKK